MTAQPPEEPLPDSAVFDVGGLATLLRCSTRHVTRMSDSGKLPRPLKLGALVRWRRAEIDAWLAAGCPSVRQPKAKGGAK
jgi:excisionase family DNA binding protein